MISLPPHGRRRPAPPAGGAPIRLAINGRFLTQPTTGVQRVARQLLREIDALVAAGEWNMEVRLLCEAAADVAPLALTTVRTERVGRFGGHLWEQVALPAAAAGDFLLCLGNTAPVRSLLGGAGVAVMIHDLSYRQFPGAYRRGYRLGHRLLMPLLLRRADPVFAVSESERRVLLGVAPTLAERIVLAPNGGWSDGEAEMPERRRDNYLLYVGAFSRRKNFERALAAAIRLAREDGVRFRFVGSIGPFLAPPNLTVPADVADRISFTGHVEDPGALADLYRGARCLVFPSLYEASPLPPVEAMHFGCPVVASDIPALRERCGDAAEYCDPDDVEAIVAATRRVLHDRSRAAELVACGWARTRLFSWETQARIVLDAVSTRIAGTWPASGGTDPRGLREAPTLLTQTATSGRPNPAADMPGGETPAAVASRRQVHG